MSFDPTVTLSHILTFIGLLSGAAMLCWRVHARWDRLEGHVQELIRRVGHLEEQWERWRPR